MLVIIGKYYPPGRVSLAFFLIPPTPSSWRQINMRIIKCQLSMCPLRCLTWRTGLTIFLPSRRRLSLRCGNTLHTPSLWLPVARTAFLINKFKLDQIELGCYFSSIVIELKSGSSLSSSTAKYSYIFWTGPAILTSALLFATLFSTTANSTTIVFSQTSA